MFIVYLVLFAVSCTLACWDRSGRSKRAWNSLGIFVIGSTPFIFMRDWVEAPMMIKSHASSSKIWSIALQNPTQVVRRNVPYPHIGSASPVRIRVALASDYRGIAFLVVNVNGIDFGRMFPEGTQRGISTSHDSLELIVDALPHHGNDLVEINLRQPDPDSSLRIVVVGHTRGAVIGVSAAFFGDGHLWFRGVPDARTGTMAVGLPQIWLDGVY